MKNAFLFVSLLIINCLSYSQVPQGFNYQAIARDNNGNPLPNTVLQAKIGILSDTVLNTMVWEELHNPVGTNMFGMFTIIVGTGTKQSGSAASFSAINWTKTPLFIRTSIYYQNGWKIMGTTQLQSVPYSMVAGNLGGSVPLLSVKGNTSTMDSALFVVRNNNGQIVFAVYNEGVRIYVDDGAKKSTKGGFAVGGFGTTKGQSQPLFVVDPDSIRAYIAPDGGKSVKGGFAVGGFSNTKTMLNEEYLRVTRDSSRIYIKNPAKGVKGGFAIGSFDITKANTITPFTALYPENYFIGQEAGMSNTTGVYNSFFGYKAGRLNTTGNYNIFIGHYSGSSNTNGYANMFIGDSAGYENISGNFNTFLGPWAGQHNTTGYSNVSVGSNAGLYNSTGIQNTNIGLQAGAYNDGGTRNTNVGALAGMNNKTGSYNVTLGNYSGFSATSGDGNVFLGSYAGRNNLSGNWNVFIGYAAGRDELNSQRLYIANSATTSPLIYGEFDNGRVVINGNAGNNISGRSFFVNGTAGGSYSWFNDSDERLKHDITTIPDALQKVLRLRGVNYFWNNPAKGMEGLQIGFIGQEAVKIVPEVVSVNNDRYSMQYAPITALLVEGMKEQQKQIESAKLENRQLRAELDELREVVNTLKTDRNTQEK